MSRTKGSIIPIPSWSLGGFAAKTAEIKDSQPNQPNDVPSVPADVPPSNSVSSSSSVRHTFYMQCMNLKRDAVYMNLSTGECSWSLPSLVPVEAVKFITHFPPECDKPYYENIQEIDPDKRVQWSCPSGDDICEKAKENCEYLLTITREECEMWMRHKYDYDTSAQQLDRVDHFAASIDEHEGLFDFEAAYINGLERVKEEAKVKDAEERAKHKAQEAAQLSTPPPPVQSPPPTSPPRSIFSSLFSKSPSSPTTSTQAIIPSEAPSSSFKSKGNFARSFEAAATSDRSSSSKGVHDTDRKSLGAFSIHEKDEFETEGHMNGYLYRHKPRLSSHDDKDVKGKRDKKHGGHDTGLDSDWVKRYFVLRENVITYYESYVPFSQRKAKYRPMGEFQLFGDYWVEICSPDSSSGGPRFTFRIVCSTSGELIRLAASTDEERTGWVSTLEEFVRHAKGALSTFANYSVGGGMFSGFSNKERYFILNTHRHALTVHPSDDNVTVQENAMTIDHLTTLRFDERKPKVSLSTRSGTIGASSKPMEWTIVFDQGEFSKWRTALEGMVVQKMAEPVLVKTVFPQVTHPEEEEDAKRRDSKHRSKHKSKEKKKVRIIDHHEEAEAEEEKRKSKQAQTDLADKEASDSSKLEEAPAPTLISTPAPIPDKELSRSSEPSEVKRTIIDGEDTFAFAVSVKESRPVNPFAAGIAALATKKRESQKDGDVERAAAAFADERKKTTSGKGLFSPSDIVAAAAAAAKRRGDSGLSSPPPPPTKPTTPLSIFQQAAQEAIDRRQRALTPSGRFNPIAALGDAPGSPRKSAKIEDSKAAPQDASKTETAIAPPARESVLSDAPVPPPSIRVSLPPSTTPPPPPRVSMAKPGAPPPPTSPRPEHQDRTSTGDDRGSNASKGTSPHGRPSIIPNSISKLFGTMFAPASPSDDELHTSELDDGSPGTARDPHAGRESESGSKLGPGQCRVRDHKQYEPYLRMAAQSGAQGMIAIRENMRKEGLDPAFLDFPDTPISSARIEKPPPPKTPDMFYAGFDKGGDKKKLAFVAPVNAAQPPPPPAKKDKKESNTIKDTAKDTSSRAHAESASRAAPAPKLPSMAMILGNRIIEEEEEFTIVPSRARGPITATSTATASSTSSLISQGATRRPFSDPVEQLSDTSKSPSRKSLFSKKPLSSEAGKSSVNVDAKKSLQDESGSRFKGFREDALSFVPAEKKPVRAFATVVSLSNHVKSAHSKHWADTGASASDLCILGKSDQVVELARNQRRASLVRQGLTLPEEHAQNGGDGGGENSSLPRPVHVRMQKETRRVSVASALPPSDEYKHFHPSADTGQPAGTGTGKYVRASQTDVAYVTSKPKGGDVPNHTAKSAFHLLLGESEAIKETLVRLRDEESLLAKELALEEAAALKRVREAESAAMRRVQEVWSERLRAIEEERRVLLIDDDELKAEQEQLHLMHMDAARLHGKRTTDLLNMGGALKNHHARIQLERRALLKHGVQLNSTLNQLSDLIRRPPVNEPRLNEAVLATQPDKIKAATAYAHPHPATVSWKKGVVRGSSDNLHLTELSELERREKLVDDAFEIRDLDNRPSYMQSKVSNKNDSKLKKDRENAVHVKLHIKPFRAGGKKITI